MPCLFAFLFPFFFKVWPATLWLQKPCASIYKIMLHVYIMCTYIYIHTNWSKLTISSSCILISFSLFFFLSCLEFHGWNNVVCLVHNHIINLANQSQQVNTSIGQQKSTFPIFLHLYTSLD